MIKQRIIITLAAIFAVLFMWAIPATAAEMQLHDGDIDVYFDGSDDPDNPLVVTVMDELCRVVTTEDMPNEEILVYGHVKLVGLTGNETLHNGDPALNLITVTEGSSLTIENLRLTADTTSAIIANESYATLNLEKGAVLEGSESQSYGGGIRNQDDAVVNINGGIIRDCYALYFGGGIYNSGTVIMNSGMIANCYSDGYHVIDDEIFGGQGGGISNTGTVIINGGSIVNCSAGTVGGGICTFSYGDTHTEVTINGGAIYGCSAPQSGGGFFNGANCTFNFHGGVIYNNSAPEGPNVMSQANSTLNATGGMVTVPMDYTSYGDGDLDTAHGIVYGLISDSDVGLTVTDYDTLESIEIASETRMLMANRNHTLLTSIAGNVYTVVYDNGMWRLDSLFKPDKPLMYYNNIKDSVSICVTDIGLYTLIFATFDKNGNFEDFKTQTMPFLENTHGRTVELYNINFDTDSSDTLKIMLWNSVDGVKPVCAAAIKQ